MTQFQDFIRYTMEASSTIELPDDIESRGGTCAVACNEAETRFVLSINFPNDGSYGWLISEDDHNFAIQIAPNLVPAMFEALSESISAFITNECTFDDLTEKCVLYIDTATAATTTTH